MSKAAPPFPAYLLKADDPVVLADAARSQVDELAGKEDPVLTVEEFSAEEDDLATVAEAARTPPFLSSRRVVVCRDVDRLSTEQARPLLSYLAEPLESTALVLVAAGSVPPRLVSAVKKVGHVQEVALRGPKAHKGWVAARLKEASVRLDARATALVTAHVGEDAGRLVGVLHMLEAVHGEGARLGIEQVTPFLGEAGGVAPWDLTDAIDGGDVATALSHLRRMLEGGQRHPLVVLASLHSHYERLLRLDGADVAGEEQAAALLGLKGSTYPARKALGQTRRLGHDGVTRAFGLLAGADLALKGTLEWPAELVLEVLVARLCRLRSFAARR